LSNLQLFIAAVAIWGSTWLAITFQLGRVAPEASVFYRFLLASAIVFAYCLARRLPLRYSLRQHLWIALLGILMFSVSYIFVYYAEQHVVSGLVAVGYSASPMLGLIGMRVFFGTPMTRLLVLGSILGMVGIALVFWPEFAKLQGDRDTALGALHTIIAVVVSAFGAIVAQRNQRAGCRSGNRWRGACCTDRSSRSWSRSPRARASTSRPTMPYVLSLVYLAGPGLHPRVRRLPHAAAPRRRRARGLYWGHGPHRRAGDLRAIREVPVARAHVARHRRVRGRQRDRPSPKVGSCGRVPIIAASSSRSPCRSSRTRRFSRSRR
jgi:drug/metabolite transporter (DMT)-like permease